ncbi:glycosyltransferase WbuB [Marinobacterium nitratireducens]|uniref:Glycosyltransferase WbuB n=1 Tax=Marinobacterium nitratireducens TaxID=518897 RepID=A0A917ZK41_9GAMM|nr:glycosyltransferase family 4 protein [Marinobacterium nitratireducens]GGO85169.1 glycosyltransferase WbuB [Marinobacterium nitratireducens]
MKIIYLHQYFTTPEMSGGTRSFEMARRLVDKGHEVHIITSWRDKRCHKGWWLQDIKGIKVHWLPVDYNNSMSYRKRLAAFFKFAGASAVKAASIKNADLVFATSTPLTIAIPGIYASKRLKIPMVFEVRDLWPEMPIAVGALNNTLLRWAAGRLEKFAYRNSKHVIALSPGMKEGVIRGGVSSDKVTVIPNGSDLELFSPSRYREELFNQKYPELAGEKLIVYAGTLGKINGVEYFVDVAKACQTIMPACRFAIFGDGLERDAIIDKANKLGCLGKNLYIYDPVSKNEMTQVLGASDLSLSLFINLEPMWVNSANKFFDTLASGTPIAINYGGWQEDLIQSSGAGLVLPPSDPTRAAELIVDFLNDQKRCIASGEAALKLAREQFDRDKLALQLEHVLLETVKK